MMCYTLTCDRAAAQQGNRCLNYRLRDRRRSVPRVKVRNAPATRTLLYIRRRNRACCAALWHVASRCNAPLRAFGARRPARRGATAPARRIQRGEPSPSRQGCHDARRCARASVWRAKSRCRCGQGRAQSRCRHGQGVSPVPVSMWRRQWGEPSICSISLIYCTVQRVRAKKEKSRPTPR